MPPPPASLSLPCDSSDFKGKAERAGGQRMDAARSQPVLAIGLFGDERSNPVVTVYTRALSYSICR